MKFTRHLSFTVFLSALVFVSGAAAQNSKELRDGTELVNKASTVVTEVMNVGDKAIPSDLLSKAKAIVVFPGSFKAAFIIGGQGGHGVAIRRTANGWSAPAFLKMGGGSFGAQIGGEKTDYVLLIMNDKGLNALLQDKFEIGAEGSVTAGPVGRTGRRVNQCHARC